MPNTHVGVSGLVIFALPPVTVIATETGLTTDRTDKVHIN